MKSVRGKIFLGVLVIISMVALIFGYKLYEKEKQENAILSELEQAFSDCSYVKSYELGGEDANIYNVTAYVTDSFNDLDYSEIESFIKDLENEFSIAHLHVMIESLTQEQLDDYHVSAKVVCDDTVYTYQIGSSILKNGIPFDSESFYRDAFRQKYELDDAQLDKLSEIPDDVLDEILTIKYTSECKKEINYQYGLALFNDANFSLAKMIFFELANDRYKDSEKLRQESDTMESLQGTWETADEHRYLQIIFNGWKMCITDDNIIGSNSYRYKSETGLASVDDFDQIIFTPDDEYGIQKEFFIKEDKLYQVYADLSLQNECVKVSEDTTFPNIVELVQPYIGMTAEEVVTKSTWGNPKDINTTITEDTTYEQWCYPGFKYIYLENGIVTAIQK